MGVFENGVLRSMFGPKSDEVRGDWIKLHNEELNGLYLITYIPRFRRSFCIRLHHQDSSRIYQLTYLLSYLLTYSIEQNLSWEANRLSASQEMPTFYGTRRFITAITKACTYLEAGRSSPCPHISLPDDPS